jgi:hypothetical protein
MIEKLRITAMEHGIRVDSNMTVADLEAAIEYAKNLPVREAWSTFCYTCGTGMGVGTSADRALVLQRYDQHVAMKHIVEVNSHSVKIR